MEFLFKELGAAIGIAQILGGIPSSSDLQSDGASLKRRSQRGYALPMRMIQRYFWTSAIWCLEVAAGALMGVGLR